MEYKGYTITSRYKTVSKSSPVSGHEWSEYVPMAGFRVLGKTALSHNFKTVDKAKEYIDFLVKFPFEIPRSEREIAKAKELGL